MHINSYSSVYALGHKAICGIFNGPVVLEEKIDGSQFSMGIVGGELSCRSKGTEQRPDAPDSMFQAAIDVIRTLPLHPGYVYRCEYLRKPKHNTLAYDRTPKNHLIIFDIQTGMESYMTPAEKAAEAERLGLECVPLLHRGVVEDFERFKQFLERESVLGGVKIEGIVVKNYSLFTQEKKIACGKFVSEAFKESHTKEWKNSNPTNKDILALLTETYKTEARWRKAVQHLRESGNLENSPRDIGKLIREVPADILKENEDDIKAALFTHAWPHIQRGVVRGFAEWYKAELAQDAFSSTINHLPDVGKKEQQ